MQRTLLATVGTWLALAAPVMAQAVQPEMSGDIRIHDPSIVEIDGKCAAFYTGQEGGVYRGAIRVKTSEDCLTWKEAGGIGKGLPKWVRQTLGFQPPNIWAPSITEHAGRYYLYYSVSVFGINTSAIGLMTAETLDPDRPTEGWQDQGLVLASNARDDWNAIDPWRIDLADGRAFLVYGSFWTGIKMRELDPVSGMLISENTPQIDLASRDGAGIEASSLIEHEGKFYLFVSFDQCCKALNSTYRMMVGRADAIEGPYLDKDGKPMLEGGGTELLARTDRFIGPGGQEVFELDGQLMLAYHYYDAEELGVSKLQIAPLRWTDDGWPALDALPQ